MELDNMQVDRMDIENDPQEGTYDSVGLMGHDTRIDRGESFDGDEKEGDIDSSRYNSTIEANTRQKVSLNSKSKSKLIERNQNA